MYRRLLNKEPDKVRSAVSERMQHWWQEEDFVGVRDPAALAKLPEVERKEWQTLWQEVQVLASQPTGPAPPKK